MSEVSRIVGVFFEPSKTFRDIAQRPSWLLPMILVIIAVMGVTTAMGQHIGWDRLLRHQMETNSRFQQMSADQREQNLAMQMKFAPVGGYVGALIGVPLYDLVVAAVLLGIAGGMMGGGMRFKQVFAAVCWSGMPGLISAILTVVVIFLKNPDDFNMQNPIAFNLGAFLDTNTSSKFVYSLATSIDLFVFWTILLMATGLKAAAGKKLSFTGALVAVMLPWAVVVLGKSALAGMFS
ncbi:MAG TPA: Yip1 family protein [Bryobacteraceae bacterium]|nr:Yip1 family protein [Bryobacteraceae bacterium]